MHSVVGEFKASAFKQIGVALRSFFAGMVSYSKKAKLPSNYTQLMSFGGPGINIDIKKFQGAQHAVLGLAKLFRSRFIVPLEAEQQSNMRMLKPLIAFVHLLVLLSLHLENGPLDFKNPKIPNAKKLFYLGVLYGGKYVKR